MNISIMKMSSQMKKKTKQNKLQMKKTKMMNKDNFYLPKINIIYSN
jgi:hypothetical protein